MNEHPFSEKFAKYHEEQKELSLLFASYIKDKSVPLSTRWEVFTHAPEELSQNGGWVTHFESFERLCHGYTNPIEDKFYKYVDRGSTVKVLDMYDCFIEDVEDIDDWDDEKTEEAIRNGTEPYYYDIPEFTKDILEAWQEEALAKNLKSFEYDW